MSLKSLRKLEFWLKIVDWSGGSWPQNSKGYTRNQLSYKNISTSFHQRHYSSNIVTSPFKVVDIPNKLIPEMIWETVDKFPESTAMKCGLTGQSYSFAELQKKSFQLANSLRKSGFKRGETIAIVLPNCPDYPILTLGALEAELAVCFVHYNYTADEICNQLKDSGSVCVVTGAAKLDTVLSAISKVEQATQSKPVRRVILLDIPPPPALPSGVSRYSEMISDSVDHVRSSTSNMDVNDLALLPYSSGTTGLSKGVCLSHRNIVANTYQIGGVEGLEFHSPKLGQDIVLGILPFFHIYGLVIVLFNGLKSGATVVTLPKFEKDSFIRTMDDYKISVMMMVPPLMLLLGNSSLVTSKHLAHLRKIISGAAPMGTAGMEKVGMKLPKSCFIIQGYGLTETSPVLCMPRLPAKNLATVGAPLSQTMAKVIDVETGETLGPGQTGELCFQGPQVMLGYLNNPKATAEMLSADRWLRTGDIGYYDEDKHFYVIDRLKELIKVKAFQVPPAELEEILRTHPLVRDAAVIGVPDSRTGETPVAYIVPVEKGSKLTEEEIKTFLSGKVSLHKQVSRVIFTDSIPKTAAGKILRKELREIYKHTHEKF